MNPELRELLSQPTASVVDVGRICFGMSPKTSNRAALDGGIPTINVGGKKRPRKRVPTNILADLLGVKVST